MSENVHNKINVFYIILVSLKILKHIATLIKHGEKVIMTLDISKLHNVNVGLG